VGITDELVGISAEVACLEDGEILVVLGRGIGHRGEGDQGRDGEDEGAHGGHDRTRSIAARRDRNDSNRA